MPPQSSTQPSAAPDMARRFHVTALSNLALGYDRYERVYSKRNIRQSRFSSQFFLLEESDVQQGIQRARALVSKLGLPNDDIIALETTLPAADLRENTRTGIGQFIESDSIHLTGVYTINDDSNLTPLLLEDAYAKSMRIVRHTFSPWADLTPRSISILPIARGCQARCAFCFSEGSVSLEQKQYTLKKDRVIQVLQEAKARGAERAVITGGGEPGMLKTADLCDLVKMTAAYFSKIVMISNGYFLSKLEEDERRSLLQELADSGLSVLSLSRHHYDAAKHQEIMKLDTACEKIVGSWKALRASIPGLKLRMVCVLQKNGIDSIETAEKYVRWTEEIGVEEICFKELYVASGLESVYYDKASNLFCAENQVPLRVITELAKQSGWTTVAKLPWGAPIFRTTGDAPVQVAAYTEPNVTWELQNSMCRSWNLMATGQCYASLEDRRSLLEIS